MTARVTAVCAGLRRRLKAAGAAMRRTRWALRDACGAIICRRKGRCHYRASEFRSNCLYFCSRCGKEMFGRTFDDLLPMNSEEMEDFYRREWGVTS